MTSLPTTSVDTTRAIGKLCVGGDWACANGDFGGLRYVARQLADFVPAPMQRELVKIITACTAEPDRAVALWSTLRSRLVRAAS
jgi:hypothetical protein